METFEKIKALFPLNTEITQEDIEKGEENKIYAWDCIGYHMLNRIYDEKGIKKNASFLSRWWVVDGVIECDGKRLQIYAYKDESRKEHLDIMNVQHPTPVYLHLGEVEDLVS